MRFPFISPTTHKGEGTLMPFLPLQLQLNGRTVQTYGLLDTGATVNVLPYSIGLKLGAVWEKQTIPLRLSGNLANTEARALFADAYISDYEKVQLAFAWSQADNIPLLLGQTNFFMEFDVLFSRSSLFFDVFPKGRLVR